MNKQMFRRMSTAALLVLFIFVSIPAHADTRLYVPQFQFNDREDTQFLIANQNDHDATVDFWAFTSVGELLGQFQMPVKAHGTHALTLGEAFQLTGSTLSGWIGAVSSDDGIQLSYTRIGATSESFEAQQWASREVQLGLDESGKEVVRISNPNPFAASITINGTDQSGRFVGVQELSVAAFGQLEVPASGLLSGQASRLRVSSNADVLALVDRPSNQRGRPAVPQVDEQEPDSLGLVIDSSESIGAYQVTLSYDPRAVQFSAKDIEGGAAEGFDSKPLVVNIDNVSGQITIGSFQVGAHPNGRITVARLRAARNARFGIKVDEITNAEGQSLSGLSVGVVRIR